MANSRPWSEIGVEEFNFMPEVTATNTVKKWKQWAQEGVLVKTRSTSTHSADNGETEIQPCSADTDVPIGVLRATYGSPDSFPEKFMARVAIRAVRCNVPGAGTGALGDTDFGKAIKPDTSGKATIVSTGGVGRVVGGTKSQLVLAFDFIDNFR